MFWLPIPVLGLSEGSQRRFVLLTFSFRKRNTAHVLNNSFLSIFTVTIQFQ